MFPSACGGLLEESGQEWKAPEWAGKGNVMLRVLILPSTLDLKETHWSQPKSGIAASPEREAQGQEPPKMTLCL